MGSPSNMSPVARDNDLRAGKSGRRHPSAVPAPSAVLDPSVTMGPLSYVGHRARVEAGVEIEPCVSVGDECVIEAYAFLGMNATIIAGVTVGTNAWVCAGSVVTRPVRPHTMVRGVPATFAGFVCACGNVLWRPSDRRPIGACMTCNECGKTLDMGFVDRRGEGQ